MFKGPQQAWEADEIWKQLTKNKKEWKNYNTGYGIFLKPSTELKEQKELRGLWGCDQEEDVKIQDLVNQQFIQHTSMSGTMLRHCNKLPEERCKEVTLDSRA